MRWVAAVLKSRLQGEVRSDEPMSRHTSYRLGGPADVFVVPHSEADVAQVLAFAWNEKVPCHVVGSGSNLLVADTGIRGVVVSIGRAMGNITFQDTTARVEAGAALPKFAKLAAERGLTGLEWAGGVPGTVGGAIAMNAGAHDGDISRVITDVRVLENAGTARDIPAAEMAFGYRTSRILQEKNRVVVGAGFRFERGDPDRIWEKTKQYLDRRRRSQPLGQPSSGSIFKNPPGDYAGRLIEAVGLKGYRVNGVEVSPVHANFLVNHGGAAAADVRALIAIVRERVADRFGVQLELEVELVGFEEN